MPGGPATASGLTRGTRGTPSRRPPCAPPRIPVMLRTALLEQEQVDAADVVGVLVGQQHEVDRRREHAEAEEVGERLRRAVEQHAPVEQEAAPVGAVGEREA